MPPLEPPDTHFFAGTVGWIELGNVEEAKAELGRISAEHQMHPDVLELKWMLCAEEKDWAGGLEVARSLIKLAPERSSAWLHQAYALRRVPNGSVRKAWDALLPAFEKFPQEFLIAYNLACYACQMANLDSARLWLKRAEKISGPEKVKAMALADLDLEALWKEISES
jgi:hypothetical protein